MWELVFVIPIVAIVLGIFSDIVKKISNNRLKEKQLEFLLREKELDAGIPPGTYSKVKGGRHTEYDPQEAGSTGRRQTRQDLEKGIDDLLKRVENLDTVLAEKNASGKKNGQAADPQ